MKQLLLLTFVLMGCSTTPEFITLQDKTGNHIHTATPQSFFNAPDKPSEWSFWYFIVIVILAWVVWKEFKSVKWPKHQQTEDK